MDLTAKIYREFVYEGGVTDVWTPVSEVLAKRRGVCQDFAHLEIAALRSLGLPARYMSGYLLTHPPEGKERLVGADASHAWIAVVVSGLRLGRVRSDQQSDAVRRAHRAGVGTRLRRREPDNRHHRRRRRAHGRGGSKRRIRYRLILLEDVG